MKKKFYKGLYFQVIVAVVVGILLGHLDPSLATAMKPFGDAFIKLIKMLIAPIIFCTVVSGICGMENIKRIGRVGGKALIYFEVMTTAALVIGLVIMHVLHPGSGMNADVHSIDTKQIASYTAAAKKLSVVDYLMNIIPHSIVDAFAKGDLLQVLFFAILFGFSLSFLGDRVKTLTGIIDEVVAGMYGVVNIVMKVAPIGAFGAMAFTIGKYGIGSLWSLGALMGSFYLTCIIFIFGVLGIALKCCGFSIFQFVRYIREELLIVLGTSSSESVLPRMMEKMEHLGCEKSVVGLVIPTGYSFNLDGTCIYLTMASLFIAQACNVPLTLGQELTILAVLLLTSKGAAGVTGSGFITLAATLSTISTLPIAGLALILGIDRFMSEARALTNLVGNGVATLIVAKWENALDENRAHEVLGNKQASN